MARWLLLHGRATAPHPSLTRDLSHFLGVQTLRSDLAEREVELSWGKGLGKFFSLEEIYFLNIYLFTWLC